MALCQGVPYLRCLRLGDRLGDPLGDRFRLLAALGWGARRLLAPLGAALGGGGGLANSGTAVVISAFSLILSGEWALEAPAANRNNAMAAGVLRLESKPHRVKGDSKPG